eukprot:98067_1
MALSTDQPLRSRTTDMKVIGLGLSRTGTRSLQYVLEVIGFGPSHHSYLMFERVYEGKSFDNSELLWWESMLNEQDKSKVDWDVAFNRDEWDNCQSAQELASKYYKELAQYYSLNKNVKYILTKRDPNKWFKSCQKTFIYIHFRNIFSPKIIMDIIALFVPYLTDFSAFVVKLVHDIYGENISFKDDEKEHCISIYNKHNQDVEEYFTSNDMYKNRFFVIDLNDGPNGTGLDKNKLVEELQEFLNIEPTKRIKEYPQRNTSKQFYEYDGGPKFQQYVKRKLAVIGISGLIFCGAATAIYYKYIKPSKQKYGHT